MPTAAPTRTRCQDDPEGIVGMRSGVTCESKMTAMGGMDACDFWDSDYDGFARWMWQLCPDYCHACGRTAEPTSTPTMQPTVTAPTHQPTTTSTPTQDPTTSNPTSSPTNQPTSSPISTLEPTESPTFENPCACDGVGGQGLNGWGSECSVYQNQDGTNSYVCTILDGDRCDSGTQWYSGTDYWGIWPSMAECQAHNPTMAPTTSHPTMEPTSMPTTSQPTFEPTYDPSEDPCQCDGVGADRYGGWGAHCTEYHDAHGTQMFVCTMIDGARCDSGSPHWDGVDFWGVWSTMDECLAHDPQPTSAPTPSPTQPEAYLLTHEKLKLFIPDLQIEGDWEHVPASGSTPEHILRPNGQGGFCPHGSACANKVTVKVQFTDASTQYQIKLYAYGANGQDDSFFVSIDGENVTLRPTCQYGFNIGRTWKYHRGSSCDDWVMVHGNPGEIHEVVITPREDGTKLGGVRFQPR